MPVGIMKLELYIAYCHSLKEKRAVLKKILNRLREKYNLSVAEVDYHNKWQRSLLAFACIGSSLKIVDSTLESALEFVEQNLEGHVINVEKEII
ncbi:MAG: uncharacterized protein PWQ96_1043 [Clostridia bacterium]|nr:uncharacterized protein [Clostridia bacterium]